MNITTIKKELRALGKKEKATNSMRFFKTDKGQYGAGDVFLGISVPEQREVAEKYRDLPLDSLQELLYAKEHEFRLTALFVLVLQYQKGGKTTQKKLADFYLTHAKRVNNWDLVDVSAHSILGHYLLTYRTLKQALILLAKLVTSDNLWERRIAMVATWAFIRAKNPEPTFVLTEMLLNDREDLIHKATGWMLREVGKYCGQKTLRNFLDGCAHQLPRTALRYSLEHFNEHLRQKYLKQKK